MSFLTQCQIFSDRSVLLGHLLVGPFSSETKLTPPRRGKEKISPGKRSLLPRPDKPHSSEPPPLKSVSVLQALKRPEYQIENIQKEAQQSGRSSVEVVDLTDSDVSEKNEVRKGYVVLLWTG